MFEILLAIVGLALAFIIFSFLITSVEKLIRFLNFKKDHTHDNDED